MSLPVDDQQDPFEHDPPALRLAADSLWRQYAAACRTIGAPPADSKTRRRLFKLAIVAEAKAAEAARLYSNAKIAA